MTRIFEVSPTDPMLLAFATSFDHKINPVYQTFVAANDETGEWLGYFQIVGSPIAIPAWSTNVKDKKVQVRAMHDLLDFAKSIGLEYMGVDFESKMYDYIKRFGFKETRVVVFQTE